MEMVKNKIMFSLIVKIESIFNHYKKYELKHGLKHIIVHPREYHDNHVVVNIY